MADRKPVASVGMPVYNEAHWLRQSLDALLAQTLQDFELVISDNASTDETWDILQKYATKDPRIVLHRQPENLGAANFQFVLDQAQGDYFMWAAGHDLWSANLLEVLVGEIQDSSRVALCAPGTVLIDGENRPIRSSQKAIDTRGAQSATGRVLTMFRQMDRCNAFYGLHRRCILQQTFPWPKVVGNDFIVLTRIASMGDVITNQSALWFRRINRRETHQERMQRYVSAHSITGLAAVFPYFVGRIATMLEFSRLEGPYRERIALLKYGSKKLFLEPRQSRFLLREFLVGSSTLIRDSWAKQPADDIG